MTASLSASLCGCPDTIAGIHDGGCVFYGASDDEKLIAAVRETMHRSGEFGEEPDERRMALAVISTIRNMPAPEPSDSWKLEQRRYADQLANAAAASDPPDANPIFHALCEAYRAGANYRDVPANIEIARLKRALARKRPVFKVQPRPGFGDA